MNAYVKIGVLLAVAAAGYLGGVKVEHLRRVAEVQTLKGTHADTLRDIASLTQKATEATKVLGEKWVQRQEGVSNETHAQVQTIKTDAAGARAAGDGLRNDIATYRRTAPVCSTGASPAPGTPPAPDTIGVLADLFESADNRAGALAQIADESRVAGAGCERQYDTLTP